MADETRQRIHQSIERIHERYETHGRIVRVAWVLAGVVVLAAGLVMTIFPGPAIVVIPVGLAMLAAASRPARTAVHALVDRALAARDVLRRHRYATGVAVACAVAGAGTGVYVLLLR